MNLRGAKILLVDDNVDLAENLAEILSDEGASVQRAGTAAQALELAGPHTHVALVDIGLPDATGLSLVSTLRARSGGRIAVLLITGNASTEHAIRAVREGAYDYILKPFDPEIMLAAVARAFSQVRLEQEADTLASALRASEQGLRDLVDAVTALLLVLDDRGVVLRANKAVLATTGLTGDELEGKPWLEHLPESERPAVRAIVDRLLAEGGTAAHEGRLLRPQPDGPAVERWVTWQWTAVKVGAETRLYASGMDSTEVRELSRRARLSEKLAAVGTLAAGLAHEIRNPLNAASLQLQLLERRIKRVSEDPKLFEPVAVVMEEIGRLAHLVEDFLAFARPSELRAKPVDVAVVVRELVALELPATRAAGVVLAVEAPTEPIPIAADREKLQQVLLNLLRNAVEAVGPGGHVTLRARAVDDGARIQVVDDGPGIAEADLPRVFEPFFSTKADGTGLGMAICHSVVDLHGGTISIHPAPARGTVVEVTLPRDPPRLSTPPLAPRA
jgi:PAS domain S-box-containing protein